MKFAKLVKELRERRGWTQVTLASFLKVSQATVSRWEAGDQEPEFAHYQKLLELAGSDDLVMDKRGGWLESEVPVIGHAESGAWLPATEWPEVERYRLVVPPHPVYPGIFRVGYEIRGDGADQLYPDGSIVLVIPFHVMLLESTREVRSGDRVVVFRRNHQNLFETSVREYVVATDGKKWLVSKSSNPLHQLPIELTAVNYSWTRKEPPEPGGPPQVVIQGLIVSSFRNE